MKAPDKGYILKKWNTQGYRATAIAYMQRENVNLIENIDGNFYNLETLKNSVIK